MKFVEPIGDLNKISSMKKILLAQRERDYLLFVIDQKTKKENRVALSKGVKKAIEIYVKNHYQSAPNEFLFKSRKGVNQPIVWVQAWQIMSDAVEELGLENIRTHSLRKTFGYHQIKRGTNITLLMKMFNHSSQSVALWYIGITQDDMDAAVQALDLLTLA